MTYKTETSSPNASGGTTARAKAPRVVVERSSASSVSVSLRQNCITSNNGYTRSESRDEGALSLARDRASFGFVGTFRDVEYYSSNYRGANTSCEAELRVVIDGVAQIDPVSGSDVFRFRFVERQPNGTKKPIELRSASADVLSIAYETKEPPNDGTNGGVLLRAQGVRLTLTKGLPSAAGSYPSGKARAVLVNTCTDPSSRSTLRDEVTQTDLAFERGRFQGMLPNVPLKKTVGQATYSCTQELAVVVDGRWIKEPSGENFRFAFSDTCSPYCGY